MGIFETKVAEIRPRVVDHFRRSNITKTSSRAYSVNVSSLSLLLLPTHPATTFLPLLPRPLPTFRLFLRSLPLALHHHIHLHTSLLFIRQRSHNPPTTPQCSHQSPYFRSLIGLILETCARHSVIRLERECSFCGLLLLLLLGVGWRGGGRRWGGRAFGF